MKRICSVCTHERKAEIDRALVARQPLRRVAEQFGTSAAALHRHRHAGHIAAAVTRAHDVEVVAHGDDLLSQVSGLQARALRILSAAEEAGDLRAATAAVREARGCLDLLGRVTGELIHKHAHLHATAPAPEQTRADLEAVLDPEDIRTLQRIAKKATLGKPTRGTGVADANGVAEASWVPPETSE